MSPALDEIIYSAWLPSCGLLRVQLKDKLRRKSLPRRCVEHQWLASSICQWLLPLEVKGNNWQPTRVPQSALRRECPGSELERLATSGSTSPTPASTPT